jgi:transposase
MDELNEQGVRQIRKTFKYKRKPTAEQERALAFVVRRCRELYNAALEERKEAWEQCGVSVTVASQSAQLPAIKEVRPEYRDIHSQVLQDVLTRLDRAFQAYFRRVKEGEKPGYSRFQGESRYHSFTYKQFGNGAPSTIASWYCRRLGALPSAGRVRWKARPRQSRSAGKPTAGTPASPVPTCRRTH